jgi:kynurenine 3-monooxygenase
MRRRMHEAHRIDAQELDLEHGYKELSVPAVRNGDGAFAIDALHIWPRGNFMLIALPNDDGSFTATLFLPKRGEPSFESLHGTNVIEHFLSSNFPDAYAAMPDCVAEFEAHPVGSLGSVSADPWHATGRALLIGDAAHAIVPFHGQGMNCCFEDCIDLEMRAHVADPKFRLQQALSLELERRFPRRFIPRYSMVMFHHEIPYRIALERGAAQAAILSDLTGGSVTSLTDVDFERAAREITSRLEPLAVI